MNKRDQEEMCLAFGRAYGIPAVAFRMFNVYGARQALSNPYTGVAAIFCSRLLQNQPPLVFEDGEQRRDFVHVEDVARAYVLALENDGADGLALNLGSGQSISVNEIASVAGRGHGQVLPGRDCRQVSRRRHPALFRRYLADPRASWAGPRNMNSDPESGPCCVGSCRKPMSKSIGDSYAELKALGLLK